MAEKILLLKLAGEIQLKTRFVRAEFTKTLVKNIKQSLKNKKLSFEKIEKRSGKLIIHSVEPKKLILVLQKIFGIRSISLAEKSTALSIKEISLLSTNYCKKLLKEKDSFAVRANRLGKHSFSSKDIEIACGSAILEGFPETKVNLSYPKKTLFIELDRDELLLYSEKLLGPGGLPLGVEGFLPVLFEGKKGQEKTAFLLMKRGCKTKAIFLKETSAIKKSLKELEQWNNFFPLKKEKLSSLSELKKFKAIAVTEGKLSRASIKRIRSLQEQNDLMVFNPLIFYPKELNKK